MTSYPGTGRKSALLGRVRTCQALARSAHRPWPYANTRHRHIRAPHWRLDGLSTMPGEVSELRPPAPVLRGGSRIAAVSSPRHAQKSTSRRARHAPRTYMINHKNLSSPPAPMGGEVCHPGACLHRRRPVFSASSHPHAPESAARLDPGDKRRETPPEPLIPLGSVRSNRLFSVKS
jgi:hypothetical protein